MTALILLHIFMHYFSHHIEKKRQVHMQIQLITMFSRCIDSAETTVFDPSAEKEPTHCGFVLVLYSKAEHIREKDGFDSKS